MAVYLIQAGENGPVKIGITTDVLRRVCKMQSDNPVKLTVLRLLAGGMAEEAALHLRFADLRIRGEWHGFSRLMMGDLGMVDLPIPEKSRWGRPATVPNNYGRGRKCTPEHIEKVRAARAPWCARKRAERAARLAAEAA